MQFVSLHTHSTFSYLDGYGMPEDHVNRAKGLGMTAIGVTEHGNVSSHVKYERAADAAGDIKIIYGVEAYTGHTDKERRTQKKNHLGILAKNPTGYRNLLELVSRSWKEGFYYQPTMNFQMIDEHKDGLILLSGCTASLASTTLVGGKNVNASEASYDRAKALIRKIWERFEGQFYLECQVFHELPSVRTINQSWERMSRELGIPLVATADVHYCEPDDREIRKILHAVRAGGSFVKEVEAEFDYNIPAEYPLDDDWVYKRLCMSGMSEAAAQEAVENTARIADLCDVRLPKIENLRFPLPVGVDDSTSYIRDWLREGWVYRGINRLPNDKREKYRERLLYELDLIEQKDFTDYFLVMSDLTKYAKDSGIPVGPARGSAAASLVCYLLRITEVDPLDYPNLLFERFIDLNRHDLPDIDLDFDDERRHEVREYLVDKYGSEKVGNIGTFTQYKGKNSIDDVARVYGIPKWETETLKGLLIERSSGDLRASATIEDTVEMFDEARQVVEKHPQLWEALRLEGNLRGMSIHAAGLVVANGPLYEACAVYQRESKGETVDVVSLDKHDAEYLNVLKLDILGLKTMGIIRRTLEDIGMTLEELYAVDLHDPEIIRAFADDDLVGVFQFDGRAMRNVCRSVQPESFAQICDINALARPGPLHGGATAEYIDVKMGRKEPHSFGPIVDAITSHTFGQVVYQEQILKIVREVGNFSWEEAAKIRKIISKKRGEQEFNTMKGKFVEEAPKNGMPSHEAERLWSMLVTAGAYAFNAAHCVSYGMLAYWTMWLKQKHPLEFFTASLQKHMSMSTSQQSTGKSIKVDKQTDLIKDAINHGIKVLPPSLNASTDVWEHDEENIYAGYRQIKGIGEKTSAAILEYRKKHGPFASWADLEKVKGIGPKTAAMIEEFAGQPDPFQVYFVRDQIKKVRDWLEEGGDGNVLPRPTHRTEEVPYERGQDVPIVWIGLVQAKNLKELFENHFSRTGVPLDPGSVKDPDLNEWVTMYIEDETGVMAANINRFIYPEFRQRVWGINDMQDVVIFRGHKPGFQSRKVINVEEMWVITP